MNKYVRVVFDDSHMAECWGNRLSALNPTNANSAYPHLREDDRPELGNSLAPLWPWHVPVESHVRLYIGNRRAGIYCGHSRELEAESAERGFQVRYRDGYAEVYCPHSQVWEPLA